VRRRACTSVENRPPCAARARGRGTSSSSTVSGWLERNNRHIVIGLGAVFGTWFMIKGLTGLGIL
jgi:hypothetical protein